MESSSEDGKILLQNNWSITVIWPCFPCWRTFEHLTYKVHSTVHIHFFYLIGDDDKASTHSATVTASSTAREMSSEEPLDEIVEAAIDRALASSEEGKI